ncbi:MAG: hypothetical protein ACI8TP_005074 [Acidimicrobiales bacterium]|jgi:hypothetical protein
MPVSGSSLLVVLLEVSLVEAIDESPYARKRSASLWSEPAVEKRVAPDSSPRCV